MIEILGEDHEYALNGEEDQLLELLWYNIGITSGGQPLRRSISLPSIVSAS
jgi:hypothetical protein